MSYYHISRLDFDSSYNATFSDASLLEDNDYENDLDTPAKETKEPVLRSIPGKIKTRRAKCSMCNLHKTIKSAQEDDCICPSCLFKRELMIRQVYAAYMESKEQKAGCSAAKGRKAASW